MSFREIWSELREEWEYPAFLKPGDRGFCTKKEFFLNLVLMWTFRTILLLFAGAFVASLIYLSFFAPQCKCS